MPRRRPRLDGDPSKYGMQHRPGGDGPPLRDLLVGGLAPRDIYEHPEWYTGVDDQSSRDAIAAVMRYRGRPRAWIYRAGPTRELNPGDWVALSRSYANTHRASVDPTYKVCAFRVNTNDVRWAGDDLAEWGYFGAETKTIPENCSRGRRAR